MKHGWNRSIEGGVLHFAALPFFGHAPVDTAGNTVVEYQYDPEIRRFISADTVINNTILRTNMFCYCENNPVMNCDPLGYLMNKVSDFFKATIVFFHYVVRRVRNSPDDPTSMGERIMMSFN